jgi:hypothetical protein
MSKHWFQSQDRGGLSVRLLVSAFCSGGVRVISISERDSFRDLHFA